MNTNIRDVIKDKSVKIRLRWKWLLAMGVIMGIVMSQCSNGLEPVNMEDKPLEKPLPINIRPKILAIGSGFSVGIKPDGTVWTWGMNSNGVLGRKIAKPEEGYEPGMVPGLKDAVSVSASGMVLVLKKDGTVWSWGNNRNRMLGYDTDGKYSDEPRQILGLSGIVDILAGGASLALRRDGTVWGWGEEYWLLGEKSSDKKNRIRQIQGLSDIVKIGYGSAIDKQGRLLTWSVDRKSLGRDIRQGWSPEMPDVVPMPDKTVDITGGNGVQFALLANGTMWSWGQAGGGQLGVDREELPRGGAMYPVRIRRLSGITMIASDGVGVMAATIGGTIATWGVSAGGPAPEAPLPRHDLFVPHKLPNDVPLPIKYMAIGVAAQAVVDAWGNVSFWIDNSDGQRGTGVIIRDPDTAYWLTPEKSHWSYR